MRLVHLDRYGVASRLETLGHADANLRRRPVDEVAFPRADGDLALGRFKAAKVGSLQTDLVAGDCRGGVKGTYRRFDSSWLCGLLDNDLEISAGLIDIAVHDPVTLVENGPGFVDDGVGLAGFDLLQGLEHLRALFSACGTHFLAQ